MRNDLTIVYYTANVINNEAAERIRGNLLKKANGTRIISISHKPINFGDNMCVSNMPVGLYSLFKQVLVGAREVKTKFMACAEDDYLYGPDHFEMIPPRDDTFYYDVNRWGLNKDGRYFWRMRTIFGMCFAPTQLMIDTLENRYAKITSPTDARIKYFSEPGKYEEHLGIPCVRMERIHLNTPTITFNHKLSMGKRRMVRGTDIIERELPIWGDGATLWKDYMGELK